MSSCNFFIRRNEMAEAQPQTRNYIMSSKLNIARGFVAITAIAAAISFSYGATATLRAVSASAFVSADDCDIDGVASPSGPASCAAPTDFATA